MVWSPRPTKLAPWDSLLFLSGIKEGYSYRANILVVGNSYSAYLEKKIAPPKIYDKEGNVLDMRELLKRFDKDQSVGVGQEGVDSLK